MQRFYWSVFGIFFVTLATALVVLNRDRFGSRARLAPTAATASAPSRFAASAMSAATNLLADAPASNRGAAKVQTPVDNPYLPTTPPSDVVTQQVRVESGDASSRLDAVNSLRTIGLQGDEHGYVRAALRQAMNDPNPNVKANAEFAFELLSQKYAQ